MYLLFFMFFKKKITLPNYPAVQALVPLDCNNNITMGNINVNFVCEYSKMLRFSHPAFF